MKIWKRNSTILQSRKSESNQVIAGDEGDEQERERLVAVITGAEGTIGSEILDYLLALDFRVFAIGIEVPNYVDDENMRFIKCDLSARNEVFEALEYVQLGCNQIDLLILNAAIMLSPHSFWSPFRRDLLGESIIEPHLAINVLANAQIFASLSHRLEASKCAAPRVVFVSSSTAHAGDISLLLSDEESFWCRHLNGYKSYADSKLLISTYAKYLSRVLSKRQSKISVFSVHPGVVPGKLYRNVCAPIRWFINTILAPFMRPPHLAAIQILDLAFARDIEAGAYYEDGEPIGITIMEDPDVVWLIGKSVREMIVWDNDATNSSLSFAEISKDD